MNLHILSLSYLLTSAFVNVYATVCLHIPDRRSMGVNSLLLPCGPPGSQLGHLAWWYVPDEPLY